MLELLNPFPVAWSPEEHARLEAIFLRLKQGEPYFEGHVARACFYALNFGRWLELAEDDIRRLYWATFLHDIGKVNVPVDILTKNGPLSPEEFKIVQAHPFDGEKLCVALGPLGEVAELVSAHHEKLDGSGYPRGLKGDSVPFLARILAIFEIYDALRSERGYKSPFSLEKSLEILFDQAGAGQIDRTVLHDFQRFGEDNDCGSSNPSIQLAGAVASERKIEPAGRKPGGETVTVLLAEDNEDQRAICEIILAKAGYRVVAARNGREAFEKLGREPVDVALLDIMMPEMSGLELCRKIREEPELRSIYVIFLSALVRGEDRVKGLESGADDYITKPFYHRELLARVSVGEKLIARRRELERLATQDPLTELYNRRMFEEKLADEFERAKRYARAVSFLMLDLDDFKQVNDRYGHQQGDAVLRELAAIMKKKTRRSDILARYGGEEFALILPEVGAAGATTVADKIRKEIKTVKFTAAPQVFFSVTVSVGVASLEGQNYKDSFDMFSDADKALYVAKTRGKDCVVVAERTAGAGV